MPHDGVHLVEHVVDAAAVDEYMAMAQQLAGVVGQHAGHGRVAVHDGIEHLLGRHAVGQIEVNCLLAGHLPQRGEEVHFHDSIVRQNCCRFKHQEGGSVS